MSASPSRGEIWRVDFEPVRGHEQGRLRPALIISNDIFNHRGVDLVTVIPITTRARPIRTFLRVEPGDSGLPQTSYIICDQVRTISKDRLGKKLGALTPRFLPEVEQRIKFLLDLR